MPLTISRPDIPVLKQRYPGEVLLRVRKNPLVVLQEMAHLGDCSVMKLARFRLFMLNHPDLIREVLVTQNDAFIKGRAVRLLGVLLGKGLLTSEGPFHHRQRKLVLPAFHHHKIKSYADAMASSATRMAARWEDDAEMNISDEMMSVTLDIVAKTLFGANVSDETEEIGQALLEGQDVFRSVANPLAEIILRLPFPITKRIQKVVQRMDTTIYRIIEEHRRHPDRYTDLLSMMLATQDEETGEGMADKQLRDEVMTLFTAGHETTAVALMWTWFMLAQHPDVEQKLHDELAEVLEGRPPTFDDIPQLVYTRQVFSEVLRLFPPAWAITREALQEVNIGGYHIPKGATIDMSPFILHRDARFWENPDQFNPDRFSPANKKKINKFEFIPFSIGIRGCIGEQFAWMEGIIVLATLAQQWKLQLTSNPSPTIIPIITLRPDSPIRMRAIRRTF